MLAAEIPGLEAFLGVHPQMGVRPTADASLFVEGPFRFRANRDGFGVIEDQYDLAIQVPKDFPAKVPVVFETSQKLEPKEKFHVNADGSLCLGSPLRILLKQQRSPTFEGFVEHCLIPFLYAMSFSLRSGADLPFSELSHGKKGILADYCDLLGLKQITTVAPTLQALGMKKRLANKLKCPCGCGQRTGRCSFNRKIASFRNLGPSRKEFREAYRDVTR